MESTENIKSKLTILVEVGKKDKLDFKLEI